MGYSNGIFIGKLNMNGIFMGYGMKGFSLLFPWQKNHRIFEGGKYSWHMIMGDASGNGIDLMGYMGCS